MKEEGEKGKKKRGGKMKEWEREEREVSFIHPRKGGKKRGTRGRIGQRESQGIVTRHVKNKGGEGGQKKRQLQHSTLR